MRPPSLPTPTSAGAPPPGSFVTVMAWISLGLGILGVASGIMQGVMLLATPPEQMLQSMLGMGVDELPLPPMVLWVVRNLALLNFVSLLSSAAFTVVSYGLLKRHEWGRVGFVALLAISALAGFVAAFAFAHLLSSLNLMAGNDMMAMDPVLQGLQSAMRTAMYVGAALIAMLHGAIIWKLYTPAIRAEFGR